jgi:hypothetical protein
LPQFDYVVESVNPNESNNGKSDDDLDDTPIDEVHYIEKKDPDVVIVLRDGSVDVDQQKMGDLRVNYSIINDMLHVIRKEDPSMYIKLVGSDGEVEEGANDEDSGEASQTGQSEP